MQLALDSYLSIYNRKRLDQNRDMKGKTSINVFVYWFPKFKTSREDKMKKAV